MESYKIEFIKFALSRNVLKFGEFALKSGRKSPYFFNAGLFSTGADLARLGDSMRRQFNQVRSILMSFLDLPIKVFRLRRAFP